MEWLRLQRSVFAGGFDNLTVDLQIASLRSQ